MNEKARQPASNYEPLIAVTTKNQNDAIQIIVRDNSTGIPQKILNKIFQPFFTTRPTRQGTGLGPSLSYDIIKARGGDIRVETTERGGTAFTVHLPLH